MSVIDAKSGNNFQRQRRDKIITLFYMYDAKNPDGCSLMKKKYFAPDFD